MSEAPGVGMTSFEKSVTIVFIEGIIGSGKTTIGEELERQGYAWLKEPVFEIMHFGAERDRKTGELLSEGINLLDHFQKYMEAQDRLATLKDRLDRLECIETGRDGSSVAHDGINPFWKDLVYPETGFRSVLDEMKACHQVLSENASGNPFSIQMAFFMTRVTSILRFVATCNPGSTVFIERSPISDRYFFALNLFLEKRMTQEEYQTYCVIWDTFYKVLAPSFLRPDAFVYLRVTPSEALERVHKRSRVGEEMMSLDYLADLDRVHEDFFNGDGSRAFAPALVIDNSEDYRLSPEATNAIVQRIVTFAQSITDSQCAKPQSVCEFATTVQCLQNFTSNVFSTSQQKKVFDIQEQERNLIERIATSCP